MVTTRRLSVFTAIAAVMFVGCGVAHADSHSSDWDDGYVFADGEVPYGPASLAPEVCKVEAQLKHLQGHASSDFYDGCMARFNNVQVPGGVWRW